MTVQRPGTLSKIYASNSSEKSKRASLNCTLFISGIYFGRVFIYSFRVCTLDSLISVCLQHHQQGRSCILLFTGWPKTN